MWAAQSVSVCRIRNGNRNGIPKGWCSRNFNLPLGGKERLSCRFYCSTRTTEPVEDLKRRLAPNLNLDIARGSIRTRNLTRGVRIGYSSYQYHYHSGYQTTISSSSRSTSTSIFVISTRGLSTSAIFQNKTKTKHAASSSSTTTKTFLSASTTTSTTSTKSPNHTTSIQSDPNTEDDMGAKGQHTVHTTERLVKLRELMKQNGVDAVVVPSEDQHSSEYLAHCDERRAYISGFNGSAGCAVITKDKGYLFTDGRYFLQASKQLDQNWELMKQGLPDVPTWQEFLYKKLDPKSKIGIDATLIAASDAETLEKELTPKESKLVSLPVNLVDIVWGEERPKRPSNLIRHLDEKYSGQSLIVKIGNVRSELEKKKGKALIVNMLDEVAWLFNLRGSDIDFNPVFFAYAIVTHDDVTLFVDASQLDDVARDYLAQAHVKIEPYDAFWAALEGLPGRVGVSVDGEEKIILGDRASLAISSRLGTKTYTITRSPITDLKAIKNEVELEGFRKSHVRDGVALARYFAWLEEELEGGKVINEWEGAEKLEEYRRELDLFQGLSFTTISSTGPNGAIIHYSPDPNDCQVIKKDQIYLCDSGAQFLDGTTDVTRTWHFGTPTAEEKRAFTRVLQGHINIDTAVFPEGTTGFVIDSFARRALWQDGLDYRHGTGHGVGHFLNVHEGPQGLGTRIGYNAAPFKAGMTVSNEPGYYADGKFGIRIENIVLVRKADTPNNFGEKGYLGFEHVTMCPIHKKLVDVDLLSANEKKWLNEYHAETWAKVSPLLAHDERALKWLEKECAPL